LNAVTPTDVKQVQVYLALGSNINPSRYLPLALQQLGEKVDVVAVSSAWQTPALGSVGSDFLNVVVLINTSLSFTDLKFTILRPIEAQYGRVRAEDKFAPRTIDIDILLYADELIEEELWIRPHLAVPFAELYPTYKRVETKETIKEIAQTLRDTSTISQRGDVLKFKTPP
jgi:2-amino-4-hydroxy-6-hydroxymethyldihydropteridine diphosphokinase